MARRRSSPSGAELWRPPKPLATRCARGFSKEARNLGAACFIERRVRLSPADARGVGAEVSAAGDLPYVVLVDWSESATEQVLGVFCGCLRLASGHPCEHVWATLLAADAAGAHKHARGSGNLAVLPDYDLDPDAPGWGGDGGEDWDDEDYLVEGEDFPSAEAELAWWRSAGLGPRSPAGSEARFGEGSWRRQLETVSHTLQLAAPAPEPSAPAEPPRRVELWLEVNLETTLLTGELTLDLFQREELKSGAMGALKPFLLDERKAALLSDAGDREVAATVLGLGGGASPWLRRFTPYDVDRYRPPVRFVEIPAGLYGAVLPGLAATGRLGWWDGATNRPDRRHRLAWDDGPPWRLALRMGPHPAREAAALSGALTRESEVVGLDVPLLLLAHGLVVFKDRLARLDTADGFAWISLLRSQRTVTIPKREVREALRTLGEMPSLPPLVLDEDLPVARTDSPEARPVLTIEGAAGRSPAAGGIATGGGVHAELSFRYGDHRIGAGDPRSVLIEAAGGGAKPRGGKEPAKASAGEVKVLRRDLEAEGQARRRLADLGAVPAPGGGTFFLPRERFLEVVDRLLEAGWRVEARGARLRRARGFRLSVATGIDWFDLSGALDFEGEAVALPRLLEAIRRGREYVELGDGSHGMLPRAWLERFGALAGLAAPAQPGGRGSKGGGPESLRFRRSQALLLDALLAAAPGALAAEVQVDEGFARLRGRLSSGHEVAPMAEPAGFRGELRPYQKAGLGWLAFLAEVGLGGCLADDMGLGKTIQVLALLLARKRGADAAGEGDGPRPSLVVAPRSLVYNWLDEAARFAPELATLDYTGSGRKALRERFDEHDLVVTTYGTLRRDAAALAGIRFGHAILDEAQAIKNAGSQTAKAARALAADHRLVLTGTPVENHLSELASLFEYVNPGMLGRAARFQELFGARRIASPEDEPVLADLARALGPFILRRTKAQVLPELPPKTEQTLLVTLDRSQRALYDELRSHYRARLTSRIGEVGLARSKMQVLEALLRLRQAACHPGLLDPERAGEPSAKLEALREQLAEVLDEGHKALVFSQFTSLLALVRRDLDADGVVYEYLDGRTRDRAAHVQRFQGDPDCRLFLISLKAGGTGLNLTAADYVFLLDPWWNPAVEAQAMDRAHRIGQQRPVIAYRLIAKDTVEEKILELQETKRDLAEAVLAAGGGALERLSPDDLELLLS
jgi:superfamily II DNA or RNA helicase